MGRIVSVDGKAELTAEQLRELEEAKAQPIAFDDDCPELSPAMIKAFRSAAAHRKRRLQYA